MRDEDKGSVGLVSVEGMGIVVWTNGLGDLADGCEGDS